MRVAILAHDRFPDRAKTALGVLRYSHHDVVAVLDRSTDAARVESLVPDVQDAPIVPSMAAVDDPVDALLIGVAPIGGGFEDAWRPDVRTALERGCGVVSGLHYFLGDDEEFRSLAAAHDADIWDVRRPPDDAAVSTASAGDVDATVVCTVGTDCSVGKFTTTMELVEAAEAAGHDAAVVPTGQTGVIVEDWGTPVDRVAGDFAAGVVEEMVVEAASDADLVVVEGQGSIVHPAYSPVTLAILHGAMPDALVLCHAAGRDALHGYESVSLPPFETYVDLYESLAAPVAATRVVGGSLNTANTTSDAAARDACIAFGDAIDAPATDPLRFGAERLLTELVEE